MQTHSDPERASSGAKWGIFLLVLVLIGVAGYSYQSGVRERARTNEVTAANETLNASLNQLQSELQSVTARLNEQKANEEARRSSTPVGSAAPKAIRTAKARVTPAKPQLDPRVSQLQDQVADQQKQLASTQDQLARARDELQGKLDSSHDELSGSIARTHDELAALEKKGERNYYEFSLDKSKVFHRVGPVSVSLRKVNFKNKSYDLAMMVDDNQLQKKNVNLYETLSINLADRPQAVELVVNSIGKNEIKGYISEPKYKKSELEGSSTSSNAAPFGTRPQASPASQVLAQPESSQSPF